MYSLDWHTCTFWTLSKIFEKDNHGVLINHSSLDIPHTQHIYPIVLYKKMIFLLQNSIVNMYKIWT